MRRLLAIAVLVIGCNPYSNYCDDLVECEVGSEQDFDDCVSHQETEADEADVKDCTAERDSFFDCVRSSSTCEESYGAFYYTPGASCDPLRSSLEQCMMK